MRHANPFLLLVALVPAFGLLWGWIPALAACALSIGVGAVSRRVLDPNARGARWDVALPLARIVAMATLAALAALAIGGAVDAIVGLRRHLYSAQSLWIAPAGAIVALSIVSILPERWIARPMARVAGWLLPAALLVGAAGLVSAALFGVALPAYDDNGNPIAPERIALRWAAPALVWQPSRFPPLPVAGLLVIGAGALAAAARDRAGALATREKPAAALSLEVATAALTLLACTLGLSLGTSRQVTPSGSSGYNDTDRSYIDGAYLWVNDHDGTYAFLSEMRSPNIVETGYNNRLHLRTTLRVALFHSPEQGMAYSWYSMLPAEYYFGYFDRFIAMMLEAEGIYRNDMRRGSVGIGRIEDGQWRRLPTALVEDFENDALVRTFRLPSGAVRFDRDATRAVVTGAIAHSAHYQHSRPRDFVTNALEALVHGWANFAHALGTPKRLAVPIAWIVTAFFAIVLVEHAMRCLRLALRDLAHIFVPQGRGPACGRCGYDLRGVPAPCAGASPRCPECGDTSQVIPPGERIPLPGQASPFNPARWLGAWPCTLLLATALAASCVVTQGFGWGQRWSFWHSWIAKADLALAFAALGCAQALLAASLLAAARTRPGPQVPLRLLGFALLLTSAGIMTALAFVGVGGVIPWRRWPHLQGLAPTVATIGVVAVVLFTLVREVWALAHGAGKDPDAS